MSSSGGIDSAIDRITAIGGDCVQVFTQSPRMWRPTDHKPEAIQRFHDKRREGRIGGVVCHALYLCNLAAPDDDIYEKSVQTMRNTVDAASAIGADAVIFHVGSHLGAGFEAGLERTCAALERILERCDGDTWLLMENSAGAGGTIGRSLDELATLLERLDGHPRLGVCLDSCHLYVSGYDVADPAVVDGLLTDLGARLGRDRLRALHVNDSAAPLGSNRDRLRALHVNDSAAPLGSNRDRHANILEGEMGEGLGAFLAHPDVQHLSAYLEVPGVERGGPNAEEIQKLRDLHSRWTA